MNETRKIKEGVLKDSEFESTKLNYFYGLPNEIIFFQVGGTTY